MRPLNILRNLTRFGLSIARSSEARRVGVAAAILDDLPLEDPHLHSDGAEGGLRGRGRVIDVRAQRVKRNPTLVVALDARDLGAAQAATRLDLDPLRTHPHRALHRALHRATERNALRELRRDLIGDQLSVELGSFDLLDVDADLLAAELGQLIAQLVDFGALLPDHDAGPAGVDRHHDLAGLPLDLDVRDGGVAESRLEILAEQLVFLEERREVTVRVPARLVKLRDSQPETNRMRLLTH